MKEWISRMLSEGDGSPSTKRVLFCVAVASAIAFCVYDIAIHNGLTPMSVQLASATLVATGGSYAVSRFAESNEPTQKPPQ